MISGHSTAKRSLLLYYVSSPQLGTDCELPDAWVPIDDEEGKHDVSKSTRLRHPGLAYIATMLCEGEREKDA